MLCEFQKQINEIIHTNVALVFISCGCSVYKLTHNIFIAVKFQIYFVGLKNQVFVRLMTISASLKYICMGSPPLSVYIYISNIVSEFLQLFILRAVGESAPSSHHHISTVHTHWGTCSRLYYLCHLCEMQMSRDFCEIKWTANFFLRCVFALGSYSLFFIFFCLIFDFC